MTPPITADRAPARGLDHAVSVYDDDADLITSLAAHLQGRSLRAGHPAVVVATPAHLAALDVELRRSGIAPERLRDEGFLHQADAQSLLDSFMVDGVPDPELFREQVGGVLRAVGKGGPVAVFGEMVALLWADGSVSGALRLEQLWNELADELEFTLLCAYPTASLATHPDLQAVSRMCGLHSSLIPPERYRAVVDRAGSDDLETRQVFLAMPQAVAGVRRWLTDTLVAWGHAALLDDILIAASELATNAVLHAQSAFRGVVTRHDGVIRIAFEDLASDHPALNSEETELLGGRGVHLVEQLAHTWGVEANPAGKVVWAEFRTSP